MKWPKISDMLLSGNKVSIMTKKNTNLDQLTKVDDLTRAMTSVRKNSAIESALASAPLPKSTVSKAMATVLRSHSELSRMEKLTQNMTRQITSTSMQETIKEAMGPTKTVQAAIKEAVGPTKTVQAAIKEAMGPTKTIQAAIGKLPSNQMASMMNTIASQSVARQLQLPKINPSLPRLTNFRQSDDSTTLRDVAELGKAIRDERKKRGLTQQKFADLAGVGRRFLSELESGKPTLEIGKVLKVTAAAGIQLMYKTPS